MNAIVNELAEVAAGTQLDEVPADVRDRAAVLLLDTLVCMLGGAAGRPAGHARRVALAESGPGPCRLVGHPESASLSAAALANGVAARYLDLNDTYLGVEPIHPSDVIPALLALAEQRRATGEQLITAIVAAYEALCRLCDSVSIRARGFDGVGFVAMATALGAARLLGADPAIAGHAIAITAAEGAPLLRTRMGELSMWKAIAGPVAARNGLHAAMLASEGVTGPPDAFAGPRGYCEQISGPFTLAGTAWRMRRVRLKVYPAQYFTHTAIDAALSLRAKAVRPQEITAVSVKTYAMAFDSAVRERAKWAPETRETADHSLPYCLVAALADGEFSSRQLDQDRLRDPVLGSLLGRLTVTEDPDLTARYPEELPCVLTATLTDGRQERVTVDRPPGDPVRGYDFADVLAKARALDVPALAADRVSTLADAVRGLASAADVSALSKALMPAAGALS